ncbi:mobilization protein [Undibacterium jejuense]|uniref:Mobilization protein n=1 Tax=Undibacterium jejuense TaxID=1344949 RepID=A0A923KLR0_9BURK|nr:mobilization protein [Undibacterium jejuense]MBC3863310.1 mobilization protein [Undibacterium jejuense]
MSKPNLNKLLQQKAELEARIQQTRNREALEERKRDTRRKILAGAYVIKLAENDLKKLGRELIAAGMLEPRDYALFGVANDLDGTDPDRLALV